MSVFIHIIYNGEVMVAETVPGYQSDWITSHPSFPWEILWQVANKTASGDAYMEPNLILMVLLFSSYRHVLSSFNS